jgi:prepilin-type N-terminal cleavage/methylation domain-containing protein
MHIGNIHRRRSARPKAARGFTLVEVLVALTVSVIALLGLTSAMTAGSKLQIRTEEYALASRAIRQVHERLHSGSIDARVAELLADPVYRVGPLTVAVEFPEQLLVDAIGGPVPAGWRYRDADGDGQVELDPLATALTSLVPASVTVTWAKGEMRSTFLATEK